MSNKGSLGVNIRYYIQNKSAEFVMNGRGREALRVTKISLER
jgi:hypothetical protein